MTTTIHFLSGWGFEPGMARSCFDKLSDTHVVYQNSLSFFQNDQVSGCDLGAADAWADDAWLVGWSLGGMLARELYAKTPDRWRGCVTVASPLSFVSRDNYLGVSESDFCDFELMSIEDMSALLERFQRLVSYPDRCPEHHAVLSASLCSTDSVHSLQRGLTYLHTMDHRRLLADLNRPVHHVVGRRDALVNSHSLVTAINSFPHHPEVVCMRGGHMPFVSQATQLSDILETVIHA